MSLGSTAPDSGIWVPPANRLATLPAWPWDPFDKGAPRTLGYHMWAWSEGSLHEFFPDDFGGLVQPNGPRAKKRFEATPDQIRWWLWWYALDEDAHWLFDTGARRLAKGSGKSPFAGVSALGEFCAPVRLERFDDRMPGGARGRPVDMPLVEIAATAESQTANTMRMVRAFAPKGSEIVDRYNLDPGKQTYYKNPEGTLHVITSSATAAEGAESSFVIGDETEHWKPSNGGPDLAATLLDNLAKSGSRMLETSNAWVPGAETVAEGTWDAWVAQEEGKVQGESKILYDARIASPHVDIADPVALEHELQQVYGDCTWKYGPDGKPDVRSIITRIYKLTSKVDDSKRKYLNWPSTAQDAWIEPAEWDRGAHPEIEVVGSDEIVIFFDGSKSRDATALVGCRLSDGHTFTLGVWEPNPAHDSDDTVDANDVDRVVQLTFDNYAVVAFFADVREWESFALTEWPRRYGDKLELWAVPQGKPAQPIAWDMRSHAYEFALAAEATQAEISGDVCEFTHDGNPVLRRHVVNCHRRPYKNLVSVGKESPDSAKKIDAAVCVIGARMVRRLVLASTSRKKKRSGSIW